MSEISDRIIDDIDKHILKLTEYIESVESNFTTYTYWLKWNFKKLIKTEIEKDIWIEFAESLKKRIKIIDNGESSEDYVRDQLKECIINYRKYLIDRVLRSTDKNCTCNISLEIEFIQEDVYKQIIGNICCGFSLKYLLGNYFNDYSV